jgi:hypothetical protein
MTGDDIAFSAMAAVAKAGSCGLNAFDLEPQQ